MKAIKIIFIILIFNVFMSFVASSGIFAGSTYYEDYAGEMSENLPRYINETSEEQGQMISSDIISLMFSTFTFGWLGTYANHLQMTEEFAPIILGLNIIGLFLIAVAVLEIIWVKRSILGD